MNELGRGVGLLLAANARSGAVLVGFPPNPALLTRLTCGPADLMNESGRGVGLLLAADARSNRRVTCIQLEASSDTLFWPLAD